MILVTGAASARVRRVAHRGLRLGSASASRPAIRSRCAPCSGRRLRFGEAHARCAQPRRDRRVYAVAFRGQRSRGFFVSLACAAAFDSGLSIIGTSLCSGSYGFASTPTSAPIVRPLVKFPLETGLPWPPRTKSRVTPADETDIDLYVDVGAVYQGVTAHEDSMRGALAELSRDNASFFYARINAIVSGFSPNRSIVARQQRVLSWLCTPAEIDGSRTLPGIDPIRPSTSDRDARFSVSPSLLPRASSSAAHIGGVRDPSSTVRRPTVRVKVKYDALG